ncbi:glycosyltransferase family 4 protein [Caproiciproducens galactitolivorans]|uniref:Glycosyl transferases group 1 n=1 Tax=Caproiciproducens galactitolivorans TaxID=642589 RepID=A0A4Z0Y9C3_9FIRM|nr:glycosyltransferase [Caproiciproducens galactitolivorans]QEY33704.1 glycosyltransferase family 4 protein [Caproiciproducens galactitolivorans]TGJ76165.1 glycosyl transferases group 1 [Caproiciproducens galactitolivorans]
MDLMYLTFQEDAPLYLGVKNKIEGQISAFEKLGYRVTCSMWQNSRFRFFGADSFEKPLDPAKRLMKQMAAIANEYIGRHPFDVLYMRLDRISFDVIRICKTARANHVKTIVVEIPNYPYLADYVRNIKYAKSLGGKVKTAAKVAVTVLDDRLSGKELKKYIDAVVLYGNKADSFFGVKAMNGDNGINIDRIEPIPHCADTAKDIAILGVAGTLWWQGYDRILQGMSIYKQKHTDDLALKFVLVGGDKTEMPEFHALVEKLGLSDDVTFCGFKKGKELSDIYKTVDVGASSLGCYRRGLTRCSSLKAREYCAAALPFLYAYDDAKLRDDTPFALRLPNDESPVDMDKVVEFVQRCRKDASIAKKEREFAEKNYDWKTIMKQVLEFAGASMK